jgi:Protein of unknown function (DUF2637)
VIAVDRPPAVTAPSLLRPDSQPLLYAAAAIVAALAAIAFVLSFSALRDLAVAAHVSVELAWLWPLAVDGNIVVNTVAGLLLRPRGRTVSWYPWAALFLFSAVSVVGNGLHATTTSGLLALDPVVAFVVSAIPAVALLQGSHLFVVMLSAPTFGPDISPAPVGAATRTMLTATNGQPSTGRDGRGKGEVVVVGATHLAQPAALDRDESRSRTSARPKGDLDVLRTRLDEAAREGRRVTGGDVAIWLGVSQRTGRRRLADLLASRPELAQRIAPP